jgi:hypothetical protein
MSGPDNIMLMERHELRIKESAIRTPQLESVLLILPEPEEPDHDEQDGQKIGPDDSRDREVERIIFCPKDEDSDGHGHPASYAFSITENATYPKSNDDPWPPFPYPVSRTHSIQEDQHPNCD